jgi:hypothetical protein
MRYIRQSVAWVCIGVPLAGMLSIGCGLFGLPVSGPKAIAANSHLIQFTVDITDEDGTPLSDVQVSMVKYSITTDLFFGEVDKAASEAPQKVNGRYTCNVFGNYAVQLTFEKAGYGSVTAMYAEADVVAHGPRGGFMSYPKKPDEATKNVKNYPQQHVILARSGGAGGG